MINKRHNLISSKVLNIRQRMCVSLGASGTKYVKCFNFDKHTCYHHLILGWDIFTWSSTEDFSISNEKVDMVLATMQMYSQHIKKGYWEMSTF